MIKVMLVDDEMLVRLGIKSLIQWESHGFQFIGDAPDGAKALELMKEGPPDILLTDIAMPNMNGIELIEAVKSVYPDTVIIVLSSHNEYEYVRKAMKLGVEDYLLKTSLKPVELLGLLVEVSGKIRKVQSQKAQTGKVAVSKEARREKSERMLSFALSDEKRDSDASSGLSGELLFGEAWTTPLPPGTYLLAIRIGQIRAGVQLQSAVQLLKHLIETELEGSLNEGPIQVGEYELAALIIMHEETKDIRQSKVENLVQASGRLLGISLSAETIGPFVRWVDVQERYDAASKVLLDRSVMIKTSRDDIKTLLAYMKEHYAESLSLRSAADMINMSEAYLSTVFKKETGTGFIDWINMLRIEKAAAYLIETDMPSYLISERVGYENSNYFGRIFKKIKGVSPQKYRTMHGKG